MHKYYLSNAKNSFEYMLAVVKSLEFIRWRKGNYHPLSLVVYKSIIMSIITFIMRCNAISQRANWTMSNQCKGKLPGDMKKHLENTSVYGVVTCYHYGKVRIWIWHSYCKTKYSYQALKSNSI